jgi:hypothetical protein
MSNTNIGAKNKYCVLLNILDQIRAEAPKQHKKYHPLKTETEKINQARARAFIHLYLKVKFGLTQFEERERYITDDPYDGGIDAYYINHDSKIIYLIQSKFRTTEVSFHNKEIEITEILNMEIDRILDGEKTDESGNNYNSKIVSMRNEIKKIDNIARYTYQVVILANMKKLLESALRKLVPGYPCQIYDYTKCYQELVFPVICGTYYNEADLYINLNLNNKDFANSRINYPVTTKENVCNITVIFVPTIEIAKIMYKYRNSILKYNPRSYLDLSKNVVNKEISKTMKQNDTNEFALFNNGITILSDQTNLNEKIGHKDKGQLYIKNPQIINGGQTAYTLSRIYEESLEIGSTQSIFANKEVMLKVITIDPEENTEESILALIEDISKATNQQSEVTDADRRSNEKVQIELQRHIFENFGYFYERKRGEFYDGIKNKYIDKTKLVDRETFLKICYATSGKESEARNFSNKVLFNKQSFDKVLNDTINFTKTFFAYLCHKKLDEIQKSFNAQPNNKYGVVNYGNALRYGKMAVISVCYSMVNESINADNITELVDTYVEMVLLKWQSFENYILNQPHNKDYFIKYVDLESNTETLELNFDNYYKGKTLNSDLKNYFKNNIKNLREDAAITIE